jgi:hypothetical protein
MVPYGARASGQNLCSAKAKAQKGTPQQKSDRCHKSSATKIAQTCGRPLFLAVASVLKGSFNVYFGNG